MCSVESKQWDISSDKTPRPEPISLHWRRAPYNFLFKCSSAQYSATLNITMHQCTVQCISAQYRSSLHSTLRQSTVQCMTAQCNAPQHTSEQPCTLQCMLHYDKAVKFNALCVFACAIVLSLVVMVCIIIKCGRSVF